MKIYSLKKITIRKAAVLATGAAAALLVATVGPLPAQANPGRAANCAGCHSSSGSIAATPSTATPAANANYTVALSPSVDGYWITGNGASVAGGSASSVTMKAPAAAGAYTYTVYIRNGGAAQTTYRITVGPVAPPTTTPPVVVRPVASFTAAPATGVAPLTVRLTGSATNNPTSWAWNFGNGTTSAVQSPSVTYTAAGTYTVSLTATNAGGTSTPATRVITVTAPPTIPPTIPPTTPPTTIPPTIPPTTIPPTTPPTTPSTAILSRLSPSHGYAGTRVTITGTGFASSGIVKFGNVSVSVSSWSSTRITVRVPRGIRTNRVAVTFTPAGGTASNALIFRFDSDDDDD